MAARVASCRCGQLQACCEGDPVRVSVCHCFECQKRTGSAFGAQARWPAENVSLTGNFREWAYTGDSGNEVRFRFCPDCGSTVAYSGAEMSGFIAVPIGAFASTDLPWPGFSIYEERRQPWAAILGGDVEHID